MKQLLIIICLSTVSICHSFDKPNIILIFVDDMGYGDPSCYGGKLVETKNIDSLAEEGIRFTQGYTISPVCGPSRVGLMTGSYPGRFGIYWNPDMGAVQIPKERPILPVQLKKAGYTTALVGKWNLSNPAWDPMPPKNYFDKTFYTMVWEGEYWPDEKGIYHGVNDKNYGSLKQNNIWGPIKKGDVYLTDLLSQSACEFISNHKSKNPFFLYLSYNAPHSPLQGKKEHLKKLTHIKSDALKLYASMILSIDEGVGDIQKVLKEKNIKENTLIIFLSDNGPAKTTFKGLPKEWPRGKLLGSTAGLRGNKGKYTEGGIRVPFIMTWPNKLKQKAVYEGPVVSIDIYPTLSKIAGIKLPQNETFEGVDIMEFVFPKFTQMTRDEIIWCGSRGSEKNGAIRKGDWKLIFNDRYGGLYNLKDDPYELIDAKDKHLDLYNNLKKKYEEVVAALPQPVTDRKN